VMAQPAGPAPMQLLREGALFSAAIVLLRTVWIFGETWAVYLYRVARHRPAPMPDWRELLVLSWGGMRGVLSLAAAVSVPYTLAGGQPFAQRSRILFYTFSLIVTSLVLQGLTMPWLIRALGFSGADEHEREERHARRQIIEEALRYLGRNRMQGRYPAAVLRDLMALYERRLHAIPSEEPALADSPEEIGRSQRNELWLELLGVERESLLKLRDTAAINDESLRTLQRELDLLESHVHTGSGARAFEHRT
jgi:NhaP-type Na+/H+ and K+/H+ antiporter